MRRKDVGEKHLGKIEGNHQGRNRKKRYRKRVKRIISKNIYKENNWEEKK